MSTRPDLDGPPIAPGAHGPPGSARKRDPSPDRAAEVAAEAEDEDVPEAGEPPEQRIDAGPLRALNDHRERLIEAVDAIGKVRSAIANDLLDLTGSIWAQPEKWDAELGDLAGIAAERIDEIEDALKVLRDKRY